MLCRRTILAIAAVLGLSVAACAPTARQRFDTYREVNSQETAVEVENNNWADVTVYLLRGGMRSRLGMVTSMEKRTFRIPAALTGNDLDVRLLVAPIGSRDQYSTGSILVGPGQTVQLRVENNLNLSNFEVW